MLQVTHSFYREETKGIFQWKQLSVCRIQLGTPSFYIRLSFFWGIDDEPLDGIGHNIFKRTHDHS